MLIRKLWWQKWVSAFDSPAVPTELTNYLIEQDGVSLWNCPDAASDRLIVANIAARQATATSVFHLAEIEDAAITAAGMAVEVSRDDGAPVERLSDQHREVKVADNDAAERFVNVIRDGVHAQVFWAEVEASIVALHEAGELRLDRCGEAALKAIQRGVNPDTG